MDIDLTGSQVKFLAFTLIVLGAGYYAGSGQVYLDGSPDDVRACRTLCESMPVSPSMSYDTIRTIDGAPHCFCKQTQTVYDFQEDKIITWDQSFDLGVVSGTTVRDSIPEAVRQQRQEQLQQQQNLLQQQLQQSS